MPSAGVLLKLQSATSSTTTFWLSTRLGDAHTPPQPLLRTAPFGSTDVSKRQTWLPFWIFAATAYPRWPLWPSDVTPKITLLPTTTGDEKMRASSCAGLGGCSGSPVASSFQACWPVSASRAYSVYPP